MATRTLLLALFGLAAAAEAHRTLVVLANKDQMQASHSDFLADLEARGHELTVAGAKESGVSMRSYGEWAFDNVMLLAPRAKKFAGVSAAEILEFVDAGGNLFVAADDTIGSTVRDLAAECGVDFDAAGSAVVDHFHYQADDAAHTLVLARNFVDSEAVLGKLAGAELAVPVAYRGVGMAVNDDNILAVRVLAGAPTTYSAFVDEAVVDYPQSAGADTLLVASVQARNNARITFAGSLELFSNEFFGMTAANGARGGAEYDGTSNREFSSLVSAWTFQERGVLRVTDVRHMRADGSAPELQLHEPERADLPESLYPDPEIARATLVYRVKDEVRYSIRVEELRDGMWQPFKAHDMQMEFVMLDPYVRATLAPDDDGTHSTVFTAPDTYGIYKFHVMYRRVGYTTLQSDTQVSLRPYAHNEFERFIPAAFPYYASAFSMMASFFVFGLFFLYSA